MKQKKKMGFGLVFLAIVVIFLLALFMMLTTGPTAIW